MFPVTDATQQLWDSPCPCADTLQLQPRYAPFEVDQLADEAARQGYGAMVPWPEWRDELRRQLTQAAGNRALLQLLSPLLMVAESCPSDRPEESGAPALAGVDRLLAFLLTRG